MGKVDWGRLSVREEWTIINSSDSNAVSAEQERIKTITAFILKAFNRYQLAKAKRVKRLAAGTDECVEA